MKLSSVEELCCIAPPVASRGAFPSCCGNQVAREREPWRPVEWWALPGQAARHNQDYLAVPAGSRHPTLVLVHPLRRVRARPHPWSTLRSQEYGSLSTKPLEIKVGIDPYKDLTSMGGLPSYDYYNPAQPVDWNSIDR
ncbi:hypothetical protein CC2G_013643 [Coprinopsis cinerea AmutBmut pab1-1]|nr:hypothetical protein CC2G_013643 [Coprinopsis cinerea AmutBmut pab1-1]